MGNLWGLSALLKSMGKCCLSRPASICGRILTTYTSHDVFSRKECWGRVDTAPHIGVKYKFPKKILGAWVGVLSIIRKILKLAYCRNRCAESNQILHSDKDQHNFILFMGGPNVYNKSKMADGRHWKSKNRISQQRLDLSKIWHDDASVKISNFKKSMMADGCNL